VPIQQFSVAGATGNAVVAGNLNSDGDAATSAATMNAQALLDASTALAATSATLLSDTEDAAAPGTAIFAVGDVLTLNTEKGGRDIPTSTFTVAAAATAAVDTGGTIGELMEWFQAALGIDTTTGLTPTPGVTIDASGQINIVGNVGTNNDLNLQVGDLLSSGATGSEPLTFTKTASATGESIYTSMVFYDSLGTAISCGVTMVLVDKAALGTTWRWFGESVEDTDLSSAVGTGEITFGNEGQLLTVTGSQMNIDRENTGAVTPLQVTLDFSTMTALAADGSTVVMTTQDGFPVGTLSDFAFGPDGRIIGTFTNGLTKTLGQVVLATFANDSGLVAESDNLFAAGPNSGVPAVRTPLSSGTGKIASGALELSNVDLSREFINLIIASTGFSAASRVINSSNQLLTELLQTVR